IFFMFRRTRDQLMGGGGILSSFTKSPAQRHDVTKQQITFEDVAGLEGVKTDLQEIVDFLKSPERFQKLGGRVPKGVLLMGPPGTGKTLLARAVAGEAGVPFFSISGSEFIQMFVGVGAGRVRDMFKTAKDAAPSILFIDEVDAVGRHRGAGMGGGNDEREQTLNQILSEMDGFLPNESVIVLAATNRPDVLDPALLRPGRFDRHVTVDRPTLKGRIEIFGVHVRDVPLDDDVDLKRLAAGTVGLTGADIRNLVNEAALWATRQNKTAVSMEDFEHARDRILMGPKREEVLNEEEKEKTAYHEAGHALLAWLLPGNRKLHKVTVIPRGRALGVTQLLPDEDRLNLGQRDLDAYLAQILGGRSAEKLIYNELSAGAENDLQNATKVARRMVTHWGMSERLGPVSYQAGEDEPFLGKEFTEQRHFSDHTAQVIDEEVKRILLEAAERADQVLAANREKLVKLTEELISREELSDREVEEIIGPAVGREKQSHAPLRREA
ncbi:MAG: ATP-dependent zinc metalloprotease FtsH, partial [Pirellulales bacterium]